MGEMLFCVTASLRSEVIMIKSKEKYKIKKIGNSNPTVASAATSVWYVSELPAHE